MSGGGLLLRVDYGWWGECVVGWERVGHCGGLHGAW